MRRLKLNSWFIVLVSVFAFVEQTNAQVVKQHLSPKDQSIISISSFTAQGRLTELKKSLNKGLDDGLTVNEIKEILIHTYAYCGFPRSIRGLQTFMEVIAEREAQGIKDNLGKESTPITSDTNKYECGKKILSDLTKTAPAKELSGYSAFAPTIDTFLKEHLFADIFERDVLTYTERELVTISVITAIGNAEPMLKSHLSICLNIGFTKEQLKQFLSLITPTLDKQKVKAAKTVLNEILNNNR